MCQFSKECNNFLANPRNSSQCEKLCVRNPQLQLDIPDKYSDRRPKGHYPEVELEDIDGFRPPILKQLITDTKTKEEEIMADEKLTRGEKRDQIGNLRSKVATQETHDSVELETLNHPELNVQSLGESLKQTGKQEALTKEAEEAVTESVQINPEAGQLWNVPKRKKKKLGR